MKIFIIILVLSKSLTLHAEISEDELKKLTKCYDLKNVTIDVEYDKIQWSPNDEFVNVCSFSLEIFTKNSLYVYLTRRWRSPNYCKRFLNEWNEIKKKNKEICVAGHISHPEKTKFKNKEVLKEIGYWEVIKSENWCHTYFMGNCRNTVNFTESF